MENKCSDPELPAFFLLSASCPAGCSASCPAGCSFYLLLPSFFLLPASSYSGCSSSSGGPVAMLPALPASSCFLLDGVVTLSQKKGRSHSSPPKFPPFFQKLHPAHLHLTPYTLRTVSHLSSYHSDGITFSEIHLER